MVTLAFAQAASIIVMHNPGDLTGGEEGAPSAGRPCPTSSSESATRLSLLARARLRGGGLGRRRARRLCLRPRDGRGPRERGPRRRPRPRHLPRQAARHRRRRGARRSGRHRPRPRTERLEPAPDDVEFTRSARHGRPRQGERHLGLLIGGLHLRGCRSSRSASRDPSNSRSGLQAVLSQPLFILGIIFIVVV